MKVSGIGTTVGPGQARQGGKVGRSSSGAFAQHLAESPAAEESSAVETPAAVGGMEALLAAQAVGDSLEKEERKRFIKRGEDLLDKLEELRHGLLLGSIPKEKLIELAQLVRTRRDGVVDPRLAAVLDDIELRAEVELAKLGRRDG